MIVKLEDFLRRRSKISLVVRQELLLGAPGLKEACEILFGEDAEMRLQEYIDSVTSAGDTSSLETAENQCADA